LPGGGFVAGLIFAAAVILQYMMGGIRWVEDRSRIFPQYWIAAGLLMAGAAATAAWLMQLPFLSALAADVDLGPLGHLHLSSVMLFDLGVFAVVVGSTLFMLVALSHQSLRFYKKTTADTSDENQAGNTTEADLKRDTADPPSP